MVDAILVSLYRGVLPKWAGWYGESGGKDFIDVVHGLVEGFVGQSEVCRVDLVPGALKGKGLVYHANRLEDVEGEAHLDCA